MLKIDSLKYAFGDNVVYQNLNLQFNPNEITGILGENGVGKTTLFRILSGVYQLSDGVIDLNGRPLRKSDVSFLPTDPYFYPYMTGSEYLKLVLGRSEHRRVTLSNPFDLPLHELIETYSTGMKKKLAFSAIMSQKREVLILDEPFNGVDLQSNELLKMMIQKIKLNRIVVVSSHIISTLTDTCDCIYYLAKDNYCRKFSRSEYDQILDLIKIDTERRMDGMQF